jgi:cysteinyl-tRNA synthetase
MSASRGAETTNRAATKEIWLTNTLGMKRERLETRVPGQLSFYSCGPTVYGPIHIGNLRAAIVADTFYRLFCRAGYQVTYVRNFTDVDDKIIEQGVREKISPDEVAKKYREYVERDYAAAGLQDPTHKPCVTDHIPEIIATIQKILDHGKGYVTPEGEVLFSIESFESYGKLSRKSLEDLQAGHRVEVKDYKKNPFDFSLWKPAKPGEPYWESPWGRGRPGWHIECSAMSSKWLGSEIDVHHGGEDLIFPHHENEIAQSEAASGHSPFVRTWVHNGFLNFGKVKMSKSLGNVVSARDYLAKFGGEFTRAMMHSAHYRAIIEFSEETVDHTLANLERLYEAKARAQKLMSAPRAVADRVAENAWSEFASRADEQRAKIWEHLANDLNVAGAWAELFNLIREFNRTCALPLAEATPGASIGAGVLIAIIENDFGSVLGIGQRDATSVLERLQQIRKEKSGAEISEEEILQAIDLRLKARQSKNFAESDRIRDDLLGRGVVLKDGPQGTTWSFKS